MSGVQQLRFACSLPGMLLLVIMVAGGCGLSSESLGVVKGKVTIDGRPAENGTISFVPVGQKYPTARSNIVDGAFEQEIAGGTYKVMISSQRVLGETPIYNSPGSPTRKKTEEILPPKYNDQTELQIEVGAEETEYNFDLSSK